jgi:hypothetical protein
LVTVTPGKKLGSLDSQYYPPSLAFVGSGLGKVTLDVTAGSKGAPDGFAVLWMTESDFVAHGSQWYSVPNPAQGEAYFTGKPSVNAWSPGDFLLSPSERVTLEIGDLLDETGVVTTWPGELLPDTRYVFTAYALGRDHVAPSDPVPAGLRATRIEESCLFTRGYWRDHPAQWPISSMFLGNRFYTQGELQAILSQGKTSNGLAILARQLIAAKLNIANGANPVTIQATVDNADALIGFLVVPPVGSDFLPIGLIRDVTQTLDNYNNGVGVPDPCGSTGTAEASWGNIKAAYR